MDEYRHCDDYIRDKSQPKCLRKFLLYKRIPVLWRMNYWKDSWGLPSLFATLNFDTMKKSKLTT
jgi:hypothetical protein